MSEVTAFAGTRALVIECSAAMRHTISQQLRDFGIAAVDTARGLIDGREKLERTHYDFVLCADRLDGSGMDGQQLLEELRRDALLPHTTVFLMLAGEATFTRVTEAAEAALDSYLLRPYRANDLLIRLQAARHRKQVLAPLFEALNRGDLDAAVAACLAHHAQQGQFATLCLRTAAELQLRHRRVDEASRLFQLQADSTGAMWARLGLARSALALGQLPVAQQQLDALTESGAESPDLLDVRSGLAIENGEFDAALAASRRAVELTPYCMLRLQSCGAMAFYQRQDSLALDMLERTRSIDPQSRLFDAMSWMFLALLYFDAGAAKGLIDARKGLVAMQQRYPASRRLKRLLSAAEMLVSLVQMHADEALSQLDALVDERHDADFDVEAALLSVAVWCRFPQQELGAARQERVISELAQRHAASPAACAALRGLAARNTPVLRLLEKGIDAVESLAQRHRQRAPDGDEILALQALLNDAERTMNPRLINLALHLLGPEPADAEASPRMVLRLHANELRDTVCRPITVTAGMRRSGRSAGGMVLRLNSMAPAPDLAPMLSADDRAREWAEPVD
ncbi:response regulator [Aquabacterium sp. OR-4]|uniref:response regulator n=1 Tax=Aquabacterium sp. OR-4 TaxID=2978127 RepID=UPI0021B38F47|nr:response regulator [Aquabacterium sp. OR-4]MDT7835428.1 response regulator [Aquabacterium sp. OR-4]